jgi:ketosteroid isomerase-like protein
MNATSDTAASIKALHRAWSAAVARGDIDSALQLLASDYTLWAPATAPVTREALRPVLSAALQQFEITSAFERDELLVSGELAFERGWDIQSTCPRGGGETQKQRQYLFLILRRGNDGQWRFARAMRQPTPNA